MILMHNHPSDDPSPSHPDHQFTQKMKTASAAVGLEVAVHIVIGSVSNSSGQFYFSHKEADLL